ncbi:hypothetical protein [Streptomyces olivaceus]|uniref:hypothetical protein n=1 Tax=Streptomyces olivaceus TaxID=47716 RepID=UPI004056BC12
MTPEDLLTLLVGHRERLADGLPDAEDRQEVAAALRELHEAVTTGRSASPAVRRLRRALSALPPEHPVSEALRSRRYAADGAGDRPAPATDAIGTVLNLLEARGPGAVPESVARKAVQPGPDPADLLAAARERLLSVPALSGPEHAQLLASQGELPDLIRLADPRPGASGSRCPRFQFLPGTLQPLPVVLRVNSLLRADVDPWGAADWWLGGNSWLHGVPADLLGTLPDEDLEGAALELVESD